MPSSPERNSKLPWSFRLVKDKTVSTMKPIAGLNWAGKVLFAAASCAWCSREEQGEEQGRAVSGAQPGSHRLLHGTEGGRVSDDAGMPARTTRARTEGLTNDQSRQGGTRLSIMPPSMPRMGARAERRA